MKRWCSCVLILACLMTVTACSVKKTETKKLRDIEFTVMDKDEIPAELMAQIEEEKEEPFKLTYGDGGYLYIAAGYGRKNTSGYSVGVPECYETSNAIYIKTSLSGPAKDEEIRKKHTYPYVVVKIEYNEKNVVFEEG